jgi:hypothetical protein
MRRIPLLTIALLALPVSAMADDTNPSWLSAQRRYFAESEALHFCLSRYDSSLRNDTPMPNETKDAIARCVFQKIKDNSEILMRAEELFRKSSQ